MSHDSKQNTAKRAYCQEELTAFILLLKDVGFVAAEGIIVTPIGGTSVKMRKERTTISGDRYLIFYTFEDTGEADARRPAMSCEPAAQPAPRPQEQPDRKEEGT
jgi:hypothetical protein